MTGPCWEALAVHLSLSPRGYKHRGEHRSSVISHMTCGNATLWKQWKRLVFNSHSELERVTRKGFEGGRWTAGRKWTDSILSCFCQFMRTLITPPPPPPPSLAHFVFHGDLSVPFRESTPAQGIRNGLFLWLEQAPFTCLKKGIGVKVDEGVKGEISRLGVLTWQARWTQQRRAVSCGETLPMWAAPLPFPPPAGPAPAPLRWLLCNYSDAQPLTISAVLPVDQSRPFLARGSVWVWGIQGLCDLKMHAGR